MYAQNAVGHWNGTKDRIAVTIVMSATIKWRFVQSVKLS